jgi:hypothetical protein
MARLPQIRSAVAAVAIRLTTRMQLSLGLNYENMTA